MLLREHPERRAVSNEVHSRPYPTLRAPEQVSHLAILSGEAAAAEDRATLARLCALLGCDPPAEGTTFFAASAGTLRLRWERHTEFSTFTFMRPLGEEEEPFAAPAIQAVPQTWMESLPPKILVAVHAALLEAPPDWAGQGLPAAVGRYFASDNVAGSLVAGGMAAAWTDFVIHEDGFGRVLVMDRGLRERQAGRLVQRLLEIETYRTMALLGFPVARELAPQLSRLDRTLTETSSRIATLADIEGERTLLATLTRHAAEIERLINASVYRFGASRAYYALVERRIAELREQRIEGLQTIAEFMERRLAPAMRTCEATAARLEALAQRVGRASNLLRTRVDIELEAQNRDVLKSMSRRVRLQLRLQETVEGLSVVAISYYAVGLVGYAAKAGKSAGLPIDIDLATGVAIPVVLAAVWLMVRRIRRHLLRRPETDL